MQLWLPIALKATQIAGATLVLVALIRLLAATIKGTTWDDLPKSDRRRCLSWMMKGGERPDVLDSFSVQELKNVELYSRRLRTFGVAILAWIGILVISLLFSSAHLASELDPEKRPQHRQDLSEVLFVPERGSGGVWMLRVTSVQPGSRFHRAGLRVDDRISSVEEREIEPDQLVELTLLLYERSGKQLGIRRDGQQKEIVVEARE